MATCARMHTHTFLLQKRGERAELTKKTGSRKTDKCKGLLGINNNDYFKLSTVKQRGKHGQQVETQLLFMRLLELIIGTH